MLKIKRTFSSHEPRQHTARPYRRKAAGKKKEETFIIGRRQLFSDACKYKPNKPDDPECGTPQ
jgi:hypothetical protein